jgi:hypothetical protein
MQSWVDCKVVSSHDLLPPIRVLLVAEG